MKELSKVMKSLSDPNRVKMIKMLQCKPIRMKERRHKE